MVTTVVVEVVAAAEVVVVVVMVSHRVTMVKKVMNVNVQSVVHMNILDYQTKESKFDTLVTIHVDSSTIAESMD